VRERIKQTEITLQTSIRAPIDRCFDLARSIDFHQDSVSHTSERAVSGVTSGLIGLGEEVEWRARHFGLWLTMRVRITALNRPTYFQDTMVKGLFRYFKHDHTFKEETGATLMIDQLSFGAPIPLLGNIVDKLVLKKHLHQFLERRNQMLKSAAESDQWPKYLP
jgi:ligand-binding SRPBCC domain-containing protein